LKSQGILKKKGIFYLAFKNKKHYQMSLIIYFKGGSMRSFAYLISVVMLGVSLTACPGQKASEPSSEPVAAPEAVAPAEPVAPAPEAAPAEAPAGGATE